jgi:hypothetical protein
MGETVANLQLGAIEVANASAPGLGLGSLSALNEFFKSGEFGIYLLLSDSSIANLICQRKGFGARKTFLTGSQVGIANGAQLNAIVGPVESIQFTVTGGSWAGLQVGTAPRGADLARQLAEIQLENRNVTANPEIGPHFVQDGHTLWHNAAGLVLGGASSVSVSGTFCVFTYNQSATSVQCSSEWSLATIYGAMEMAFGKDGQKTAASNHFNGMKKGELAALGLS